MLAACARTGSSFTISLQAFYDIFYGDPTAKRLREGFRSKRFACELPYREYLQENVTTTKVLNEMSRKGVVKAFDIEQSEYRDGALDCYRWGWIHKALVGEMGEAYEAYVFSLPIHLWYFSPA
jgi:hypothetical protein